MLDIEFDHTKATEKQIVYNDIFPSIIEKQEIIDPGARSVYQLLEQYSVTEKGNPRSYRATKKARATLFKKKKKKKKINQCIYNNFSLPLIELVGLSLNYIHTIHLNKSASKKTLS